MRQFEFLQRTTVIRWVVMLIIAVGSIFLGLLIARDFTWYRLLASWLVIHALASLLWTYSDRKRKRIETNLRESRRMLQLVLDTIPVRVFWKDRNCEYLGCNRLFAEDGGLKDPDEIIGMTDYQLGWKDQADLYRSDDMQVMESGQSKLDYEEPQTSPSGQELWLRTSKIPLKNLDGEVIGVLGTYEDITERKRAEIELRDNRALLNSIMESLPFDLFALDADGRYILENSICRSHWGSIIGKRPSDIPASSDIVKIWEANNRRAMAGETVKGEVAFTCDKLNGVFYNIISPVRDNDKIIGILGVNIDITERKRAEEALRESLQTSADIVTSIPSGLFIFRYNPPDSLILVEANPEAEFLTGIQIDNWRGKEFDEIMPTAREKGLTRAFLNVMKTGETYTTENLTYKDNRIDGSFRIRAFCMPGGRLGMAFENITERTRAYEALRQSEERYRFLYKNLPIMLFSIDAEGRMVNVSQQWSTTFGYKRAEIMGRKVTEFMTPESIRESWGDILTALRTSGSIKDMQVQFVNKEGGLVDALFSAISRNDKDEGRICYHAVLIDISQLKQAERRIIKFFRAVEQSPGVVMILDRHALVEYVNPRFTEVTGYSPEEVLGKDVRAFNPGFHDDNAYKNIQKTLESGQSWIGNIQKRRKNGELYWERLSVSPILGDNGQIINYLAIGEDITDEVKIYRKLVESEKTSVIGLLAAGVAHEFKNYLCGIMGNASHTLDNMEDSSETSRARETLATIIDIADKADQVATSLLSYSRAESDEYRSEDLQTIIDQTLRLIGGEMRVLSIEFLAHFEKIPQLEISASKIRQLLLELFTNARQAITSDGFIMITLVRDIDYVRLRIGDTGGGIPSENIARIYDPFFSTKGVWGTDHDIGTGMGLALCRNIAREHGGDLTVDSITGAGSIFTLSLPLQGRVPDSLVARSMESAPFRIILVSSDLSTVHYYFTATQKLRMLFFPVKSPATVVADREIPADLIIYDAVDGVQEFKDAIGDCRERGIQCVVINHCNPETPADCIEFADQPELMEILHRIKTGAPAI